MLNKTIEEFEQKFDVNFNDILRDFEAGATRKQLTEQYAVTELPLRTFIARLGLRWGKNGREISVSEFKYRLGLENNENLSLINELETELQNKEQELAKTYQSLTLARDKNNSYRSRLRKEARDEHFEKTVVGSLQDDITDLKQELHKAVKQYKLPKDLTEVETIPTLVISDIHYGEVASKDDLEGYNEYNTEIAIQGLRKMFDQLLTKRADEAMVFFLGDLVAGLIHNSHLTNEKPLTKLVVELARELAYHLRVVAKHFDKVTVKALQGNHSRIVPNKKEVKPADRAFDYEFLLFELLQEIVEDVDNIVIDFSYSGFHYVEFPEGNSATALLHGDSIKNNDKGFSALQEMFGHKSECRLRNSIGGHTHKVKVIFSPAGGYMIDNGSFPGTASYGVMAGYSPIPPVQLYLEFDKKGQIKRIDPIKLR